MGALTESRKRLNDVFSVSYVSPPYASSLGSPVEVPPSKKPRMASAPPASEKPSPNQTSTSTVSKLRRLPPPQPLPRSVHAPQRNLKFFKPVNMVARSQMEVFRTPIDVRVQVMAETREEAPGSRGTVVIGFDGGSIRPKKIITEELSVEEYKRLVEWREHSAVAVESRSGDGRLRELKVLESPLEPSASATVAASDSTVATQKTNDVGKLVDFVLVKNRTVERPPLYKELFESASKRDSKLNSLSFEVKLAEQKISAFKLKERNYEAKKGAANEPFIPLTEAEENDVAAALSSGNRRQLLVTHEHSNIQITREVLQCLRPGGWLNDEVINLYLELLKEREKRNPKKFLKCHFFNTFFYKKLISGRSGYDYKAVRRWTTQKRIGYGLIECDKIFIPVHREIHWCLAIIDVNGQKFQYLDSLGGMDFEVLRVLARFFVDEVKDKSNKNVDVNSWKQEFVDDLPEQKNGWDCGMFMIKYADFYSRGLTLCFSQDDMPYFRKRTVLEILRLTAE